MDDSPEYIKQCEKAEEIQKRHFITAGDWYYPKNCLDKYEKYYIVAHDFDKGWSFEENGDAGNCMRPRVCDDDQLFGAWWQDNQVWLPRQDQLQEMSGYTWVEFDTLCLATAGRYGLSAILTSLETKEQAGIIVVMLEKHGKVWDGEQWQT